MKTVHTKTKRIFVAVISSAIIATMAISVSAATCPPHHPGQPVQTLINSQSAGTHSHFMGNDINGNPMFKNCTMIVNTYSSVQRCQVCNSVVDSSTFNEVYHTAWQ